MPALKLFKAQIQNYRHSCEGLTQTFYKKLQKRYPSPKQRGNSIILRDKFQQVQRMPVRQAIMEEMGKQLNEVGSLIRSQEWMTIGMFKNHLYCRRHGDRFHHKSSDNLKAMQEHFIKREYQKRIQMIRQKKRSFTINSSALKLELPRIIKRQKTQSCT